MNRVQNGIKKIFVHQCNLLSNVLPDDPVSQKLRILAYNSLGNDISIQSAFLGGGYVAGSGLIIADGVFINREVYFDLTAPITIGANVAIGHHTRFITAAHAIGTSTRRCGPVTPKPISIGAGAWICASVSIQPGVKIGDGAVVLSGSVVTTDVPANTMFGGMPAKMIKHLDAPENIHKAPALRVVGGRDSATHFQAVHG